MTDPWDRPEPTAGTAAAGGHRARRSTRRVRRKIRRARRKGRRRATPRLLPPVRHAASVGPATGSDVAAAKKRKGFLRDPLSIVLTIVIVVAVVAAALIGLELYARNKGEDQSCRPPSNVS